MKFYLDSNRFIETNNPLDISIPLSNTDENLRAWHVDLPVIEPVRANGFVGAVAEGGSVNFRNIFFNPHGHGTHTECLGHITPTVYSVNQSLKTFFFTAELVSIEPEKIQNNEMMLSRRKLIKNDIVTDNENNLMINSKKYKLR